MVACLLVCDFMAVSLNLGKLGKIDRSLCNDYGGCANYADNKDNSRYR